jgi:hypothetical protein
MSLTIAITCRTPWLQYNFQYPLFVTLCHQVCCCFFSAIAIETCPLQLNVKAKPLTGTVLARVRVLALVFAISIACGNVALRYVFPSFTQVVASTTPIWTSMAAYHIQVGHTDTLAPTPTTITATPWPHSAPMTRVELGLLCETTVRSRQWRHPSTTQPPPLTLTLGTLADFKGEPQSAQSLLCIAGMCFGCGLAFWGEVNFHMLGFASIVCATALRGLKSVLGSILLTGEDSVDTLTLL